MLVLWVASCVGVREVSFQRSWVVCSRGRVLFMLHTDRYPAEPGFETWLQHNTAGFHRVPLAYSFFVDPHSAGGLRVVIFPLWMPLLVLAVPTAVLWWRDRRRIQPGHCPKCGYNLTGNLSGRCPECGTLTPAKTTNEMNVESVQDR